MKTCAYNELYFPLAQRVLGDMYDYAVNTLGYAMDTFHKMFIVSGMAHQVEIGNPTYIAGKNGCEVAREVVEDCGLGYPETPDIMHVDKSPEYWIGWAMAYYQWKSGLKFSDIEQAVPIVELYSMYPTYHEMDIESFVEYLDERTLEYRQKSQLRRLRAYTALSQSMLAKEAGVPLRQIQLFEQGYRDINKTQGETLARLSSVLGCRIEDLLN